MVEKSSSKKPAKKRQPSMDKLSLSRVKKTPSRSTKSRAKKPKAKKTAPKKSTAKKPVRKTAAKPKPTRKRAQTKQLSIWLGPKLRLEIKFKLTKPKPKKRRKLTKKQQLLKLQRQRKTLAIALIAVGLAGSVYFGTALINPPSPPAIYSPPAPKIDKPPEAITPKSLARSEPTSLRIPDVEIETSVISVGQRDDGTMEVPKSYETAAWYNLSPTPGEMGPAVIIGHVDSFRGPAVFWRLSQLQPGQLISVKRADGKTVQFKVTEVKQFDQNNFPSEKVYGNIDHAGLRLITCGGRFNYSTGNYSHNTVVYASLVI